MPVLSVATTPSFIAIAGFFKRLTARNFSVQNLLDKYQHLVSEGTINFDEKQFKTAKHFQKLAEYVQEYHPKSNLHSEAKRLRGVYLYGEVGTGKTFLMNLFFDYCEGLKKKIHFHEFMLDVHQRLHKRKQMLINKNGRNRHIVLSSDLDDDDPFVYVAKDIRREAFILCFDEFQVTDVCDALIMRRLFEALWKEGVVLVATSNRAPTQLYLNGLNRQYFEPFIHRLQVECIVRHLDGTQDYRLSQASSSDSDDSFLLLANENIDNTITTTTTTTLLPLVAPSTTTPASQLWNKYKLYVTGELQLATSRPAETPSLDSNASSKQRFTCSEGDKGGVSIPVRMGRVLHIRNANTELRICYLTFAEICGDTSYTGAADFSALCSFFHTVFLDHIPVLPLSSKHNEARRFVTLIDEAYLAHIRLVWAAEKTAQELFQMLSTIQGEDPTKLGGMNSGSPWHGDGTSNSNVYARNFEQATVPLDSAEGDLRCSQGELASIQDLQFACRRAVSRLIEMSSAQYLQTWRRKYYGTG